MAHRSYTNALCAFLLLIGSTPPAHANMRAELAGRTLSCSGGSQVKFSANGGSVVITGPGGTRRATPRWHSNNVELWLPGARVPLGVDKDGETYAFEEAACQ
jgi:hypothetical protein